MVGVAIVGSGEVVFGDAIGPIAGVFIRLPAGLVVG